jgi:hypothetical protein
LVSLLKDLFKQHVVERGEAAIEQDCNISSSKVAEAATVGGGGGSGSGSGGGGGRGGDGGGDVNSGAYIRAILKVHKKYTDIAEARGSLVSASADCFCRPFVISDYVRVLGRLLCHF